MISQLEVINLIFPDLVEITREYYVHFLLIL